MNEKVALYEEANKSIMLENRARKDIEDRDIYLKIKQDEKEKEILKFSILVTTIFILISFLSPVIIIILNLIICINFTGEGCQN